MSASDDLANARASTRMDALEERVDGMEHVERMHNAEVCTRLDLIVELLRTVVENQKTERDRVDAVERDIVSIRATRTRRKK